MKTTKLLFTLVLSIMAGIGIAANGNSDKTETRQVSNFKGIKVSTGIDLYIKMGTTEEVKIVADDDVIDDLITEVKDGTLRIYMKQSNNWFNWNSGNQTRKAYVTVKELESIDASSGSDVKSENTLKGEELKVSASSGSDVELDVYYKNVWVDTSSGSDAKLSGKTKTLNAEASSGSDIKAQDLESSICKVKVSSGSDATVNVTDELYANASSGADVNYYGNPQIKDIDESSGGDVSQRK
ncbi:MAG TPA: head GIN domain-containing protein [Draconibacterium sp.]|nr:head GIN domain-containing protein [Draconibacterium sp.]